MFLTLLLADTHGMAKYARTYIEDAHAHTKKSREGKKIEGSGQTERKENRTKRKRGGKRGV